MTLSRRRLVIVSAVVLAIVGVVLFAMLYSNTTYVRIVDMRSNPDDTSSAPGADINAIKLVHGKKHTTTYASKITVSKLLDGALNSVNTAKDASSILGSEDADQKLKYVSLGIGGEIVVQIQAGASKGDFGRY